MNDHLTACLAQDEPTVRAFLEKHEHVYVKTLGPFNSGTVIFNTTTAPEPPAACGGMQGASIVVVHTTI